MLLQRWSEEMMKSAANEQRGFGMNFLYHTTSVEEGYDADACSHRIVTYVSTFDAYYIYCDSLYVFVAGF